MRVYYAHAMVLYGTDLEKAEAEIIKARLPGYEVVDPGESEGNPEKDEQGMRYCFKLIDGCDALAFSRLMGKITSGVGLEIDYALSRYKSVYSIEGNGLSRVTRRVSYLTREATLKHYDFWRSTTGRK
jgi:hypothetical protein